MMPKRKEKEVNSTTGMDNKNIQRRLNAMKHFAALILQEAAMLEQELPGVVSGSSTRKGLSDNHIKNVTGNREKRRLR